MQSVAYRRLGSTLRVIAWRETRPCAGTPFWLRIPRFRRVGVRRGAVMSRGRPTDLIMMDAVPEDFGASVLR
jgi:hypothetical protein